MCRRVFCCPPFFVFLLIFIIYDDIILKIMWYIIRNRITEEK